MWLRLFVSERERETVRQRWRRGGGLLLFCCGKKLSRFSATCRVSHQVKESVCQCEAQFYEKETPVPREGGGGLGTFVVFPSLCLTLLWQRSQRQPEQENIRLGGGGRERILRNFNRKGENNSDSLLDQRISAVRQVARDSETLLFASFLTLPASLSWSSPLSHCEKSAWKQSFIIMLFCHGSTRQ